MTGQKYEKNGGTFGGRRAFFSRPFFAAGGPDVRFFASSVCVFGKGGAEDGRCARFSVCARAGFQYALRNGLHTPDKAAFRASGKSVRRMEETGWLTGFTGRLTGNSGRLTGKTVSATSMAGSPAGAAVFFFSEKSPTFARSKVAMERT